MSIITDFSWFPDNIPARVRQIQADTQAMGFPYASDDMTGALLRTLVAGKPGGQFLELGTGTGLATAWMLEGMDLTSQLTTIETDAEVLGIARKNLGGDTRVRFVNEDGGAWLRQPRYERYDLIFADAWPGKYSHLEESLGLLKRGGLYVIDDMLPQPNWPAGHDLKVAALMAELRARPCLALTTMQWSTGLVIAARVSETL
ncbi:MAG: O-methyltransferase [Blastocatellia bacterium]